MSGDYVYDEEAGEWLPQAELEGRKAASDRIEVRDAAAICLLTAIRSR